MTETRRFDTARFDAHLPYAASGERYNGIDYRRLGESGLYLPPLSLGFWYNFGDNRPFDVQREVVRAAFDRGITHFDLANNYGPPVGAAEENFGRLLRRDLKPYRHEIVVTTKAGWDRWYGPYGQGAGRKHLLHSLDASLDRLGVEHVDIFYSHKPDPGIPLRDTVGALGDAVRSGKARYAGISSYRPEQAAEAVRLAEELDVPLVVDQVAYSLFNRWIEDDLIETAERLGLGLIAFSPLSQGLLSGRYIEQSDPQRSLKRPSFDPDVVTEDVRRRLTGLQAIARRRGQTLAQLALSWTLRQPLVASTIIGVSSVEQLDENLAALDRSAFDDGELAEIDSFAVLRGERL